MYLIGASGHGKVILDILQVSGEEVVGFYDRDETLEQLGGYPVFSEEKLEADHRLLIAIGNNYIRKTLAERHRANRYATAIHPGAIVANTVQIGEGTAVMAGVVINTDTYIGKHAIINTSASVDHDCHIDDYVHISPNATLAGGVTIGEGTQVGAGAVVIPGVTIGKWAMVGAGAVIIDNVPDNAVVVGNPGRVIKYSKPQP